jgi:hypothetical protein
MVGWRGVADEDGKEIEFSEEREGALLQDHLRARGAVGAWLEMQNGRAAARKN